VFVKHGKKHDVYKNPRTDVAERVPRHPEINEKLAKQIVRKLG
jgi:mRNA interferase HicA